MIIFLVHLMINTLLLSFGGLISKLKKEEIKVYFYFIFGISFVASLITGFIFLIPIGLNKMFFFQAMFMTLCSTFFVKRHSPFLIKILTATTVSFFGVILLTSQIMSADKYSGRINKLDIIEYGQDSNAFFPDILKVKPRTVPKSNAIARASKSIAGSTKGDKTISSSLMIQEKNVTIQEVNGVDWWILPLGYQGITTQFSYGDIDAYVRVNAEDVNVKPELVVKNLKNEKISMKASLGGSFTRSIKRSFANEYPTKIISQYKFIIDDELNPYVAVYTIKAHSIIGAYKTDSVLLYDFRTDKFTEYTSFEDLPKFVDIFQSLDVTMDVLDSWSLFRKGFINSIIGNTFSTELTTYNGYSDMFFVKTDNGRAWFSGMTSTSSSNDALTDLTFVDTKTGNTTLIKVNGLSDETGVVNAVQSSLGAEAVSWSATMPIMYRLGDSPKRIWVLPIIDRNSKLIKSFAVVDSEKVNVMAIKETLDEAIREYIRISSSKLSKTEMIESTIEINGVVDAYNLVSRNGSLFAYILVDTSNSVIECDASKHIECLVMATKQEVVLKVHSFDDNQVQVLDVLQGGNKR